MPPVNGEINIQQYGARGDWVTDDTQAFINAFGDALANGGATIRCPVGGYRITSTLTVPANTKLCGEGPQRTVLRREFNGTFFAVTNANEVEFSDLALDGVGPTYTGKGIVLVGGTLRPVFRNLTFFAFTDTHLEIGPDAGRLALVEGCHFRLGGTPLDYRAIHVTGQDTAAAFRTFLGVHASDGHVALGGAWDTQLVGCSFTHLETTADTQLLLVASCIWANYGNPMTLNANVMNVTGCRFAGPVTLGPSYRGNFVGNTLTDSTYTVTNQSTLTGNVVLHAPLGGTDVDLLQDLRLGRALKFAAPDALIVPGVASFNVRNSANTVNNLSITDTGAVTVPLGDLTVGLNVGGARAFILNGAPATQRSIEVRSANLRRWRLFCESDAESGANAGATLKLDAYDDAGVRIGSILHFGRATRGRLQVFRPLYAKYGMALPLSADRGDASATLVNGVDAPVQRWITPLTADREVTLGPSELANGDRWRIERPAGGAFRLTVTWASAPIRVLFPGQWVEVGYTGAEFVVLAAGELENTGRGPSIRADAGDQNVTLTVGLSETTQRFATPLTAPVQVTLATANAVPGSRFRVVRNDGGAFPLDVGGLKTIPAATSAFVDVEYTGAAWVLTGYGNL